MNFSLNKNGMFSALNRNLLSTALYSTVIRGIGPLSSLLLTLLLARMLGAAETGAFYLMVVLMTSAAIIAKFGFDTALQRFVGAAINRQDWNCITAHYIHAIKITTYISLLLTISMVFFSDWIASTLLQEPDQYDLVIWLSITIIPFSILGIHAAVLKAVGRPVWGGFIEAAALPMITITLVFLIWLSGFKLTLANIAITFFVSAICTSLLGAFLFFKYSPAVTASVTLPRKQILTSCLPLTQVELLNYAILWLPMLFLGALADTSAAGLYNIAQRLAGQLGLLLLVFSAITSPRFAAYYQSGAEEKLLALATNATRGLSLFGLPVALLFLLWPELLLGLFGEAFVAADSVLRILVLGQLVNLVTGPAGYLLAMTGNEDLLRNTLVITTLLTLLLSLLLIPAYGAIGAAWSVAIPMITQNLRICWLLQRRLGLPFFLILHPLPTRS